MKTRRLILATSIALLAALAPFALADDAPKPDGKLPEIKVDGSPLPEGTGRTSFAPIVEKVSPSVVTIATSKLQRRMKNQNSAFDEGDLKPADVTKIATDLGVNEDEVISMNRRMGMGGDTSLNAPLRGDEGGESQWQDFLVSADPLQDEILAESEERQVRHDLLVKAMEALNDREKTILTERRLVDDPKTLEDLSQVFGVSRERIRQIEVRAFEKLQAGLIRLATDQRLIPAAA